MLPSYCSNIRQTFLNSTYYSKTAVERKLNGNAVLLSSLDEYPGDLVSEIFDTIFSGAGELKDLYDFIVKRHGYDYSQMPNGARAALILIGELLRKSRRLLIDEFCDFMDKKLFDLVEPAFAMVPLVVIVSGKKEIISYCDKVLDLSDR